MDTQTPTTPLATAPAADEVSSADAQDLAQFIERHPRLFVLTGAGCSTESGIPDFGDAALHAHGQDLYQRNCSGCHEGGRLFSGFPDLNYTVALNAPDLFKAIVVDGALAENGMISFKNSLKAEDAEAIRSFLTARANELKRNPPPMFGPGGPPPGAGPPPAPAAHQ